MRRLTATIALAAAAAACSSTGTHVGRSPAAGDAASAPLAPGHAYAAAAAAQATDTAAAQATDTSPVRTPATKAGLRRLIREAMTAVAHGRAARAQRLADSFRLPHPTAWFAHTFGRHLGHRLADAYRPAAAHIDETVNLFRALQHKGCTHVVVERFTAPTPAVVGYQKLALERMKRPVALYSVRLVKPGQDVGYHLWSFVHAGGTFRWVGKMKQLAPAGQRGGRAGGDAAPDLLELRVRDAQKLEKIAAGGGADGGAAKGAHGASGRPHHHR